MDGVLPVGYAPRPLDQWLSYLERVDAADGLCVLGAEEAPRHEGTALTAGFFAVPKDECRCRGITDRRPQNSMELPLPQRRLPHGTMLGLLLLNADEGLRVYLRDLENFFPSLHVSNAKARRSAVEPPLAPADLLAAGIKVPPHLIQRREVYVAFTTLAMGDLNALAQAQEAHELLLERGGLRPDFLRYGRRAAPCRSGPTSTTSPCLR